MTDHLTTITCGADDGRCPQTVRVPRATAERDLREIGWSTPGARTPITLCARHTQDAILIHAITAIKLQVRIAKTLGYPTPQEREAHVRGLQDAIHTLRQIRRFHGFTQPEPDEEQFLGDAAPTTHQGDA